MSLKYLINKIQRVILGLFLMLTTLTALSPAQNAASKYARAEIPTPVLNTADFQSIFGGLDGKTLALDSQGLIRAVEFVALPGTVFEIQNTFHVKGKTLYQVSTHEYPPQKTGLYIDSRFVSVSTTPFSSRKITLPSKKQIIDTMLSHEGARYIWGGNVSRGIPQMFQFYPPSQQLSVNEEQMWSLYGLDCSGLLYEATNGFTPRNTSDLISFGKPVYINALSSTQIAEKLLPLDLIVWKGHVIIVLDQNHTIESCLNCSTRGGVTVRNLKTVLQEVMKTRTPVNSYPSQTKANEKFFVIRRWI